MSTVADATELPALHRPDSLVRFAWAAQLDAYRGRVEGARVTGRQALARSLALTEARLSALAAAGGDRLAVLVDEMEQRGFAEQGSVSRLVEQVRLRSDERLDVSPRWWPILRDRFTLGVEQRPPTFVAPSDAILAAEAFISHHRHLLRDPPNEARRQLPEESLLVGRQLLETLCRLATGPYGVTHDAIRIVARLAPLEPDVVAAYVAMGGPRTQLIRALERSERQTTWNAHIRQEFATLLATPPSRIYRRGYWLRALRRLRLADLRSDEPHQAHRRWVDNQLMIAMRGEKGYAGAGPVERRYALWVAAEVTIDDHAWQQVVALAEHDELLAGLLPVAKALRDHLSALPRHQRDGFWFTPAGDWPSLTNETRVAMLLDTTFASSRSWVHHDTWRWARRATRSMAARLIRDAVLAPCVVRQRSAAEALFAGGPECRRSATHTIAAVLEAERAGTSPHPVIVHRCLVLLGMLRHPDAIPTLDAIVQAALSDDSDDVHLAIQAVGAAGELASGCYDRSTGLMAWTARLARERSADEDMALVAIPAMVSMRLDPLRELGAVLPATPAVSASLSWAREVLDDPLRT